MVWSYPFDRNFYVAFLTAYLLAYAAYRLRAVTRGGAIAGAVVAAILLFAGGVPLFGLLTLFVVAGGILARLPNPHTSGEADQHGARSAFQVLATTGIAGIAGALLLLPTFADALWQRALLAAIVVSLGASFSDTLSAELGSRYGGTPNKLLFGNPVANGISGGMTLFGLAVGGASALFFAWFATKLKILPPGSEHILSLYAFLGNLLDSLLGATLQATYRCRVCNAEGERSRHCETKAERIKGWAISNPGVNAICTTIVALAAILFYM